MVVGKTLSLELISKVIGSNFKFDEKTALDEDLFHWRDMSSEKVRKINNEVQVERAELKTIELDEKSNLWRRVITNDENHGDNNMEVNLGQL